MGDDRAASKLQVAAVVGATLVGAALRLLFLSRQSLWLDETFTSSIVSHASLSQVLNGIHATESTPPLYYILTWAWTHLFGDSAAMLRTPGAIAGVLCVPASYLALRRLVTVKGAVACAWLVATSPLLVNYSLDARSYSLLVLLSIVSIWAMGALIETPSVCRWVAWTLAVIALCYAHYFGGFVVLAEILILAQRLPKDRKRLIGAVAVWVIAVLPLAPLFLHQRGTERTVFIAQRSLSGRLEEAVRQFAMGPNVPSGVLEGFGLLLAVGGLVAGSVVLWRSNRREGVSTQLGGFGVLAALFAIGFLLPLALALTGIDDHFLTRNVLGVSIAVAAVVGLGLLCLRGVPLVLYVGLGIVTVLIIQSNWRYQNVDWRGAIEHLGASVNHEPVIVYGNQGAPVAALYLHRHFASAPVQTSDLWVLVGSARIGSRALEPVTGTPEPGIPGSGFALVGESTFHGLRILHFHASKPTTLLLTKLGLDSADGTPGTLLAP